jgi:hypothetical protein
MPNPLGLSTPRAGWTGLLSIAPKFVDLGRRFAQFAILDTLPKANRLAEAGKAGLGEATTGVLDRAAAQI